MRKKRIFQVLVFVLTLLSLTGTAFATETFYENDVTPPTGRISIVGSKKIGDVDYVDSLTVEVEIYAKDDMCKDNEIKYYITSGNISSTERIENWSSYSAGTVEEITFDDTNTTNKISIVFKDKNGNTSLVFTGGNAEQKVIYDANSGSSISSGVNTRRFFGAPFVVTNEVPERNGYFFLGWNTDASANTASYRGGDIIPADEALGSESEVTLYAVWTNDETKLPTVSEVLKVGDYVNYPVNYDNVSSDSSTAIYNGWRVISKNVDLDGNAEEGTINLVSAGVPLTYTYDGTSAASSVTDLTDNFLFTDYTSSGFMSSFDLTDIFSNKYTALDSEGNPMVRGMVKRDLDGVYDSTGATVTSSGTAVNDSKYLELLAVPVSDTAYEDYWLATANSNNLWYVDNGGTVGSGGAAERGVRIVVSLREDVKATGTDFTGSWEIKMATCKIKFVANGGLGTMNEVTADVGSNYRLPECTFTPATNYEFAGWNVDGTIYEAGESIRLAGATTVTATWKLQKRAITFSAGANGTGSMTALEVDHGTEYTLPSNGFTAVAHYEFAGWNVNGTTMAVGSKVTITADTVITAVWKKITYTVTFNSGTNGTGSMSTLTKDSGSTYELPANGFTANTYYKFSGWSVNGGSTQAAGTSITITGNTTITAVWSKITYTVTFNSGTNGTGSMSTLTKDAGSSYTLPANGFTANANYKFSGWSVNGGSTQAVGTSITITGNTTITAVWSKITYTVTFSANGGSGTMTAVTVDAGSSYKLPACTFTYSGHNFIGWSISGTTYAVGASITISGNVSVTAMWESSASLADRIKIGDYVSYTGDGSYKLDSTLTGYSSTSGTTLTPASTTWRVWDIEEDGTVVIMPTAPVNTVHLSGGTGWVNAEMVLDGVCQIYTNSSLGVTAEDIESLRIEDLEARSSTLVTTRNNYQATSTSYPAYGETNYQQYNKYYTSGTFYAKYNATTGKNEVVKGGINASTTPVELLQTAYYASNPTWNSITNSNFSGLTYGDLLGTTYGWLASPCVDLGSSSAAFHVHIARSSDVGRSGLCYSDGGSYSPSNGVRPLVSLGSELQIEDGDGKTTSTAWVLSK